MLLRTLRLNECEPIRADQRGRGTARYRLHKLAHMLAIFLRGTSVSLRIVPPRNLDWRTCRSYHGHAVGSVPQLAFRLLLPLAADSGNIHAVDPLRFL